MGFDPWLQELPHACGSGQKKGKKEKEKKERTKEGRKERKKASKQALEGNSETWL